MIGDWVQVPCLIDNVEHYDAWCQVKQLRDNDLDVIGFKELRYDEIVPIPITPEILEKNEFKNDGKDKNMYYWNWSICNNCISYDKETGKIRIFHSLGELVFVLPLRYVHEVQHALKLCKIEKKIVL